MFDKSTSKLNRNISDGTTKQTDLGHSPKLSRNWSPRWKSASDFITRRRWIAAVKSGRSLYRSIADASWYALTQKLEYVAAKSGKKQYRVDPRHTSAIERASRGGFCRGFPGRSSARIRIWLRVRRSCLWLTVWYLRAAILILWKFTPIVFWLLILL